MYYLAILCIIKTTTTLFALFFVDGLAHNTGVHYGIAHSCVLKMA